MKLTKRLQAVASLVDGKSIIDVGCDHGYLSIYLTQKGINCLATDISYKCILKAQENFKKYHSKIDTKVTDGLSNIDIKYYDTVIISGMGTHTILNILQNKQLPDTLIISSNNNIELLRREITKLNYYIDNEIYIKDHKQKYIILKFKKGQKKYNDLDYIIGPILKTNKEYIKDYKKECQGIINKINNLNDPKSKMLESIINRIKE